MAIADILGTSMFYEPSGDGEPVVLVHGGFLDHSLWILTAPILAERFRVVTIDLPGHGQTGGSLDAFPQPVQFTKGELSPRFFHVSIDRVAAMIPTAEIATIEGAGHAAMLERPTEYAAVGMEFIARNATRVTA